MIKIINCKILKYINIIIALILFVLMLVWFLPHTVALRNLCLLLIFSLCLPSLALRKFSISVFKPILVLIFLSVWMLIQLPTVALNPHIAMQEILGEWCKTIFCAFSGVGLAAFANRKENNLINIDLIFKISLLIPLFFDFYSLLGLYDGHGLLAYSWLLHNRTSVSYLNNILIGMMLADSLSVLSGNDPALKFAQKFRYGCFFLLILTTFLLSTRNGMIGAVAMCLMALVFSVIVFLKGRARWGWLIVGVFSLASLVFFSVRADPRWIDFSSSFKVALDTTQNKAWLNPVVYPYPKLPNGKSVEISAYERTAWGKEAVLMIFQHPWGVGFDRNAFRRALQNQYGAIVATGHSHSGFFDFALAVGVPGIMLWLFFLYLLASFGWNSFKRQGKTEGLMLVMYVTGFFARSLVDSNMRDHMVEYFMFLAFFMYFHIVCSKVDGCGVKYSD